MRADASQSKAKLMVLCLQPLVYSDADERWRFSLAFQEVNGVGLHITQIQREYYNEYGQLVQYDHIPESEKLRKFLPKMKGYEKYARSFEIAADSQIKYAEYTFIGYDDYQHPVNSKVKIEFVYQNVPVDSTSNPEIVKFFNLPAELGMPKLTKEEVQALVEERNPEKIREKINTVYDLLQYLTLARFGSDSGTTKVYDRNLKCNWEFNRPGDNALRVNKGNCGASANLLKYVLDGNYDEVGYIHWVRPDGGHIVNYIKINQKYYIIDLVQYGLYDAEKLQRRVKQYKITVLDSLKDYPMYCKLQYHDNIKLMAAFQGDEYGHYLCAYDKRINKLYYPKNAQIDILLETPDEGYQFCFTELKVKRPVFKQ